MDRSEKRRAARVYECARALDARLDRGADLQFSPEGFVYRGGKVQYEYAGRTTSKLYQAPEVLAADASPSWWTLLYGAAMCLRAHFEGEEQLEERLLGPAAVGDPYRGWQEWIDDPQRQVPVPSEDAYPGLPETRRVLKGLTLRAPLDRRRPPDGLKLITLAVRQDCPDVERVSASAPGAQGRTLLKRAGLVLLALALVGVLYVVVRGALGRKPETPTTTPTASGGGSTGTSTPSVEPEWSGPLSVRLLLADGSEQSLPEPDARLVYRLDTTALDAQTLQVAVVIPQKEGANQALHLWPAEYWRTDTDSTDVALPASQPPLVSWKRGGDLRVVEEPRRVTYAVPAGRGTIEKVWSLELGKLRARLKDAEGRFYGRAPERPGAVPADALLARIQLPGGSSYDVLAEVPPLPPPPPPPPTANLDVAWRKTGGEWEKIAPRNDEYFLDGEALSSPGVRIRLELPGGMDRDQRVRVWPASLWQVEGRDRVEEAYAFEDDQSLARWKPDGLTEVLKNLSYVEFLSTAGSDGAERTWTLEIGDPGVQGLRSWARETGKDAYARAKDAWEYKTRALIARVQMPDGTIHDVLADVASVPPITRAAARLDLAYRTAAGDLVSVATENEEILLDSQALAARSLQVVVTLPYGAATDQVARIWPASYWGRPGEDETAEDVQFEGPDLLVRLWPTARTEPFETVQHVKVTTPAGGETRTFRRSLELGARTLEDLRTWAQEVDLPVYQRARDAMGAPLRVLLARIQMPDGSRIDVVADAKRPTPAAPPTPPDPPATVEEVTCEVEAGGTKRTFREKDGRIVIQGVTDPISSIWLLWGVRPAATGKLWLGPEALWTSLHKESASGRELMPGNDVEERAWSALGEPVVLRKQANGDWAVLPTTVRGHVMPFASLAEGARVAWRCSFLGRPVGDYVLWAAEKGMPVLARTGEETTSARLLGRLQLADDRIVDVVLQP